jgi:3-oxoacyl-[acyl-carrier-protein] synthase II
VVVTGTGIISALGNDTDEFWASCMRGDTVAESIPTHWSDYFDPISQVWSPLALPDFRALGIGRGEIAQQDTSGLIAALATEQAIRSAGFDVSVSNPRQNSFVIDGVDQQSAGVFLGTGIGGASTLLQMHAHQMLHQVVSSHSDSIPDDTQFWANRLEYPRRFNPFAVAMAMPNSAAAYLGIKFGLTGENETVCAACAAGTAAIGRAFRALREGRLTFAVAGGTEYLNDFYGGFFRGFDSARTLARGSGRPDECNRPFDEQRSGFLFSQGASAMVVLETESSARVRGANILAEITGFAESFDAHNMMSLQPGGEQIRRMISAALAQGGVDGGDVDYVNAHGTGTELNDVTEAAIIGEVFGADTLVNSTKSLLGHTIGASGAVETVVTALSIAYQTTHACRNLDSPIAPLHFVQAPESFSIDHAFTQSFAFGGHNAGLLLAKAQ